MKKKSIYMVAAALVALVLAVGLVGCSKTGGGASAGNTATVTGDVQTVSSTFTANEYAPITVQKGIPVKWTITIDAADLNNCNEKFVVPAYNLEYTLKPGENVVEFTPTDAGTIPYSCWMGMITSQINVVEKIGDVGANIASPEVAGAATVTQAQAQSQSNVAPTAAPRIVVATQKGDTAQVNVDVVASGYDPAVIIIPRGVKTTFNFSLKENSCAQYVQFPLMSDAQDLSVNSSVVVTATEDFDFMCSMSMYGVKVFVVDDLKGPEVAVIKDQVKQDPANNTFQGSGCGMSSGSGSGGGCCGASQ